MKIFGAVLFILGFLSAQPFNFDAGNNDCDSGNYVKSIITSSSLWSTSSSLVHPTTKSRLIFQAGLSFFNKNSCGKYWIYPNFDIAYKVTKNLALTSKIFGLTEESDSPQVLGGGIEYYFGSSDTLNWSTGIQRVDLKGLKDFRLTSLNINLYRWISLYKLKIRIGAGSTFFKEKSYFNNEKIPLRMEGQINYFGADILFINNIIIFGCNSRINPDKTIMNIFLQKEIF